ncbi:hypothetical protein, partial [Franconibacter pulveris]|uniref:hypothetical protein n=1 Tax=Franconibacter pulveris TaxID=435910 RepID=UPI001C30AA23
MGFISVAGEEGMFARALFLFLWQGGERLRSPECCFYFYGRAVKGYVRRSVVFICHFLSRERARGLKASP